jgi:phytoene dehydrogenase-like protein
LLADGGWNDARRIALAELVLKTLSAHLPDIGPAVVDRVLSPRDLEQAEGWPEGQAEHAEAALDQWLWMRPVPELARYRASVGGLYLCGPAMHPGGGVAGACGYNAAREVLHDLRRK